jgi:hypothetical protein
VQVVWTKKDRPTPADVMKVSRKQGWWGNHLPVCISLSQ